MAAVVTEQDAKAYLESQGLSVPDVMLQLWLDLIDEKQACLGSGAAAKLAAYALLSLLALASVYRYISSQSAPSGASRSFAIQDFGIAWKSQMANLRLYDKDGCLDALVPSDPSKTKSGAIFVATGGCYERNR